MERSDEELITQTLAGDLEAFDELMQRYERFVYKVAHSFGRDRDSALDITQSVFLKAFDNLGSFRQESQFKTWLARIAYREGMNWTRREHRHRDLAPLADEVESLVEGTDLNKDLLAHERKRQLFAVLERLNSKQRLVVILRYLHDLPVREIASILQASPGVTRNLLFRSLRKMRDDLNQTAYFQGKDCEWLPADATKQRS